MFSTETPLADRTGANACLISRGARPCPRPAFLVRARNAWMTLSAVSGALGVLDGPVQRGAGDLHGPGGVAGRELAQRGPNIARAKIPQRPPADVLQQRLQQTLI
jgi:hypothetical protein